MEEKCIISRSFFLEQSHSLLLWLLGSKFMQTVFGAAFADCSSSRLTTFAATLEGLTTAVSQTGGRGCGVGVTGFSALPAVTEKQLSELGGVLTGV